MSTEDDEVAREAQAAGAEVIRRPPELAVDPAGVVEVALHALARLSEAGRSFQTLTILLPTSPLRTADDVRAATARYVESGADFLMSVTDHDHSPLSSLVCDERGWLLPLHPEWLGRQGAKATGDAPRVVRANGAVTIVDIERFQKERNYYGYPLAAYPMPRERSIDIDTELDFALAELMLARR